MDEASFLQSPTQKRRKAASNQDLRQCTRGGSQPPKGKRQKKSDFSNIMRKRWLKLAEENLPKVDFRLLREGDSMFASEFSQEAYECLILQERKQKVINVFEVYEEEEDTIGVGDRERAVRKLIKLVERNYFNDDTLHCAISILDRGIAFHYPELDNYGLQKLMAASLFLGAKLMQPQNPCGKIVISKLVKEDIEYITIEDILETEASLVVDLDFNFQHVNSRDFLDRFIQLTKQNDPDVREYAEKVMLTFKVKNPSIQYLPSILAAVSLYYSVLHNSGYDRVVRKEFLRQWEKLEDLTSVSVEDLLQSYKKINKILKKKSQERKDRERFEQSHLSNVQ